MKRREFIALVGGVAAILWPLAVRAQQSERMRRIGILAGLAENDPEAQARMAAFVQGLGELGWTRGRNVQIETRWAGALTEDLRRFAVELVRLTPDVLMATGGASLGPLVEATQTIPIVFAQTVCPSPKTRRLTLDVASRVARMGRVEPHTWRASRGAS